jgi:hypothetical protein
MLAVEAAMHQKPLIALVGAIVCLVPLAGCSRPAAPVADSPTPSVGALWPASDPEAAARTAIGEAYGLFPPIEASGSTDREIPLPSWVKSAVVSIGYDGPVAGRGFVVTTLEEDNMPAGDTLAASLETHYRGVSVFGVDTEYAGTPAKILVQDWGGGRWTLRISPVALAPIFKVPGAEGTLWTSVFLSSGPAARWTFTKEPGVGPGHFTVAQFSTDKARHVVIDQLMHPRLHATVSALPGPTIVIVDSDGPWHVD